MHGDIPGDVPELTSEQRRQLRTRGTAVAARARELLPEGFVVGSELVEGHDGVRATVAVRPPSGTVVSAGFALADAEDAGNDDLARQIAAGAALEAMNNPSRRPPTGR